MELVIIFALGIIFSFAVGLFCYLFVIGIVPEKFKDKLFSIIPFFPKVQYSIILYLCSGLLYSLSNYFFDISEQFLKIFVIFICVIISSLFVRFIARLRSEKLEETLDEEMKRKREPY